ncbi:hypothetical protein C8F04DRAFT_1173297 [Mycena alexandri]|uniref:Uncharacterized protein n=1 Tax=Mycena alexandri TaxID=1745969 RepID=A0AAD6TGV1_9AGAR|nr:hypothetical protein C8F04DRAFT_1173297 [Mycena alexandri]
MAELFGALIAVIEQHGIEEDGWESARWEVYDTYARWRDGSWSEMVHPTRLLDLGALPMNYGVVFKQPLNRRSLLKNNIPTPRAQWQRGSERTIPQQRILL